MQKKVIALAVAALASGAALAQSNVTIYGVIDAGFSSWGGNSERATGVNASGMTTSRLGFKGEEALGNGLKAIFNLETGIEPDSKGYTGNANDTIFGTARQANVGLTGNFGTVLVGTQASLSDNWAGGVTEPMGNISARNLINNTVGRFSSEKARAVAYYSPIFSGVQLGALYGTKQEADNTPASERQAYYQFGATYANGPLAAALTYAVLKDDYSGSSPKDWTVGASYDFGVAKVFAGYERSSNVSAVPANIAAVPDALTTLGGFRDATNSEWTVGVRVPVTTAVTISASYAVNRNDLDDANTKGWHIGYDHNLSKRTTVYAAYMGIKNDDFSFVQPQKRFNGNKSFSTVGGESYSGFTVGLRHSF